MHLLGLFCFKPHILVLCLAAFRSGCISFLWGNLVKMYIMGRLPSQETESWVSFLSSWDLLQIYKHIDQGAWCSIIAFCLGIQFALFNPLAITSCSEVLLNFSKKSAAFWLSSCLFCWSFSVCFFSFLLPFNLIYGISCPSELSHRQSDYFILTLLPLTLLPSLSFVFVQNLHICIIPLFRQIIL